MQLHHIQRNRGERRKKRIGRGGKRGSYSGRGIKGQKSRAGRRIRPADRDLLIRLPKQRGFSNRLKNPKPVVLNIKDLVNIAAKHEHATIDIEVLKKISLLPKSYRGTVKILAQGELKKPINIKGLLVSESAKMKIEKAGGTIAN